MTEKVRGHALPCIRCGKSLKNIGSGDGAPAKNQPYNGTLFSTSGQFGSTVFESFHGETIEINVCDTCLLDAAVELRVRYYRRRTRTEFVEKDWWVPNVDEDRVRAIDRKEHGT